MSLVTTSVRRRPPRFGDVERLLELVTGDEKHAPSAHSTLDVLWVLYTHVLRVDAARLDDPDRDRFLLSKGHGPHAFYAVLAACGFIERAQLPTLGAFDSPLGHHPDRALVPGVEISSGSLGHGLPLGVGMTLALRAQRRTRPRVVVLLGDGELDEGSNHEAIAVAGRLGLDRLIAAVVDNGSSTHGWPGGIERRFAVEGWSTATAPGRDHAALRRAFAAADDRRPHAVVATVTSS
jgi:transketolase